MAAGGVLDVEVRYLDADGDPVVTSLQESDASRVVRGRPVRKIPSRAGQRHYPGLFWSATTGGHVPYESRLELDRLWLADCQAPGLMDSIKPRRTNEHGGTTEVPGRVA